VLGATVWMGRVRVEKSIVTLVLFVCKKVL